MSLPAARGHRTAANWDERAQSPEPQEGSEPRRRLQAGPATRGDRERLRCLSSPPSPERRCPWDIHPPTCSGKFPPGGSSRATETRELPIRLPGPERSSRTGPRGAPTARRKVWGSLRVPGASSSHLPQPLWEMSHFRNLLKVTPLAGFESRFF